MPNLKTETTKTVYSGKIELLDGEENAVSFTFSNIASTATLEQLKALGQKIAEVGTGTYESAPVELKGMSIIETTTTTTHEEYEG